MRTVQIIIIVVLVIIILITSAYVVVKYGKKYFKINIFNGGNPMNAIIFKGTVENEIQLQNEITDKLAENSKSIKNLGSSLLTGISTIMELYANSQEIMSHIRNIPTKINGVITHITNICSNPIALLEKAYLNFKGIKVLIKTSIRMPIKKIQAFYSKSLTPILAQGVQVIMVGYDNLIYDKIILPILSVIESIVKIVERIDISRLITSELIRFYNTTAEVLGIKTTFDILTKCAHIKSIKEMKDVYNLFAKLVSKIFDSIADIFNQMINVVNWIIEDPDKKSQLAFEIPKNIDLDE